MHLDQEFLMPLINSFHLYAHFQIKLLTVMRESMNNMTKVDLSAHLLRHIFFKQMVQQGPVSGDPNFFASKPKSLFAPACSCMAKLKYLSSAKLRNTWSNVFPYQHFL